MTHTPTDENRKKVIRARGAGFVWEEIAKILGVSKKTLEKYYKEEMETGQAVVAAEISDSLIASAIAGNTAAQIFFLKTQRGWRETNRLEHSGPDGQPIKSQTMRAIDISNLTDDELQRLALASSAGPQ